MPTYCRRSIRRASPSTDQTFGHATSAICATGALDALNVYLGDAVGRFVRSALLPARLKEVKGMVENIKTAFAARIRVWHDG